MPEFLQQIINAIIGGAVAENAPVMTASGWVNKDNRWTQKPINKKLAHNLSTIGEAAVTAPTAVKDISLVSKAVRHPIKAAKAVTQAAKDLWQFVKHPDMIHIYHGTKSPTFQNLRDAIPYSPMNVGIHVTPSREMANVFKQGEHGHILEAWIPRHNMETIDIGENDYRLLSNGFTREARNNGSYYFRAGNPKLEYRLLRKYGGEPREMVTAKGTPGFELDNDVTVHLLDETWPDAPASVREFSAKFPDHDRLRFGDGDKALNKQATELLSNNGKKVIKYNNDNPFEVLNTDGTAYIVTDPNVFYVPGRYSLNLFNMTKYPMVYGTDR